MLGLAACTQEEAQTPQTAPGIAISVSAMEMQGEDVQARALFPLRPSRENMIRTLSLLVFDSEGQHSIEHSDYYRFHQVANGENPDGKLNVEEPQYGGKLTGKATLCAVANMSQDDLLKALREKAQAGGGQHVLSLDEFKELVVDLPYIDHKDSVGLVKDIYMFGYYVGDLVPYPDEKKAITISLGRIITRLSLSLSVDEKVAEADLKYAIRLGNTSRKAYIFPGEHSPKETEEDSYFAPIELTNDPKHFYYYVGPHSADKEADATYIQIAYVPKDQNFIYNPDGTLDLKKNKYVQVALCNDPPGTENRNFQLNRNSSYQISIRLVSKKNSNTPTAGARGTDETGTREVELDLP
ncbi:lipoprotein [gut metagenome]|uniref:Lipoprotein n=1 Tax=gut metagenome TaxID=749906 RepID=J9D344_9ZZZZ